MCLRGIELNEERRSPVEKILDAEFTDFFVLFGIEASNLVFLKELHFFPGVFFCILVIHIINLTKSGKVLSAVVKFLLPLLSTDLYTGYFLAMA